MPRRLKPRGLKCPICGNTSVNTRCHTEQQKREFIESKGRIDWMSDYTDSEKTTRNRPIGRQRRSGM